MTARYTISIGLTDGYSESIKDLAYSRKREAIRIARHLARECFHGATAYYVENADGKCVFHIAVKVAP